MIACAPGGRTRSHVAKAPRRCARAAAAWRAAARDVPVPASFRGTFLWKTGGKSRLSGDWQTNFPNRRARRGADGDHAPAEIRAGH